MATPTRSSIPGQIYHVTARGNNKQPIFQGQRDRQFFRKHLRTVCTLFEREIVLMAYCIMTNHYHLLVELQESAEENSLAKFMHRLNSGYSHYFVQRYDYVGHVFQGRYKNKTIHSLSYLQRAIRYIHLNPVKAGLVKSPGSYTFSSYREYTNQANMSVLNDATKHKVLDLWFGDLENFSQVHKKQTSSDLIEDYALFEHEPYKEEYNQIQSELEQQHGCPIQMLSRESRLEIANNLMRQTTLSNRAIGKLVHLGRENLHR